MNNICKTPLFNDLESIYTGSICHENYYLFLNPNKCEVLVFDSCLENIGCIKTEKYQSITENKDECHFILTKVDDKDFLYKTTYDFLEFDCIPLTVPSKYKEKINDIYYDNDSCRIYIVTDHYVYSVTLDGYFIKEETHTNNCNYSAQVVRNLNGCCVPVKVPKNNSIYTAFGKCIIPYVSYIKNNVAILSTSISDQCVDDICLGDDIRVVSIFICHNKLNLLVVKCNKYNYLYTLDIKCNDCKHHECMIPGMEDFGCKKKHNCLTSCKEDFCCRKKDYCCDPVASVLESVALEQTALSHILNAEGEKIQKAVACNSNIEDLLNINQSVIDTIFNVTILEHVLQEKINRVLKYKPKKNC